MVRVGVAPCSPFSVSRELMRDAALLARDKGVMMHTHLAENDEDVAYSLEKFGCRPGQYAEDLGWTGDDVWHAHCVKLDGAEIDLFAEAGRAWPIAPVPTAGSPRGSRRCARCGTRACRWAWAWMARPPTTAATSWPRRGRRCCCSASGRRGGGDFGPRCAADRDARRGRGAGPRGECGQIAPGFRADLAIWDMSGVEAAGSWDPAALLLAGPTRVRDLIVEGRVVVEDGSLRPVDLGRVLSRQRALAEALAVEK
jgi:cytosine/adenosine deaminase-related metal-dependent hydrolase